MVISVNLLPVFQFTTRFDGIGEYSINSRIRWSKGFRACNRITKVSWLGGEVNRFPGEISGGQQQRVAIARRIAKRPNLLLGDELTGNLDTETSRKVMTALVKACEQENITAVFVTHDEGLVEYATRVIRIDSGKIVSDELTN